MLAPPAKGTHVVMSERSHDDLQRELKQIEAHTREQLHRGEIAPDRVRRLADLRAVAAFRLRPVPADPVEHVRAGYRFIRPHLERLATHPPATSVSITNEENYTYTFHPRTVLRRVLDHALDHLNQIEQWVTWQTTGIAPTPTDGWASSDDRLDEDSLPITETDLAAWLWRIDITWHMLAERASQLSQEQLKWTPPNESWNLDRVLHHVSGGFYAVWLDNPLPTDPLARHAEASRRLFQAIDDAGTASPHESLCWRGAGAKLTTPNEIVLALVETEQTLISPHSTGSS